VSPRDLFRLIGPAGWALALLLAFVAAILLGRGAGLRWDPFGLAQRRLEAAETRAAVAEADAVARQLEVEASVAQARRIDNHHQQALELREAVTQSQSRARSAHDADQPLDPDRARRLAEHDRQLCRIAPGVCFAAKTGSAGGGDEALPAGPSAGPADRG
jgi:hypothetical protein